MRFVRRGLLYALAVWFIPFAISCAIFPLKKNWPALYGSIVPVVVAAATVLFGVLYFARVRKRYVREGAVVGLFWLAMCLILNAALIFSPMQLTVTQYLTDVAIDYLMIPIITMGVALAAAGHVEVRQRLIKLDRKTEVPEFVPQL